MFFWRVRPDGWMMVVGHIFVVRLFVGAFSDYSHSWRLSVSIFRKYLAHSSYYHHRFASTARKVELNRQLIAAIHNNTNSSLSQAHSVHSVSFLSELLPVTNPEESTCVTKHTTTRAPSGVHHDCFYQAKVGGKS
jgi:hypothetical protein